MYTLLHCSDTKEGLVWSHGWFIHIEREVIVWISLVMKIMKKECITIDSRINENRTDTKTILVDPYIGLVRYILDVIT